MRRVGDAYEETKQLALKELAALLRTRLRKLWPAQRFSVTCGRGRMLVVTITGGWKADILSPAWLAKERLLPHHTEPRVALHAAPAAELLRRVEREVARYSFVEEQPYSDYLNVRFHSDVVFSSKLEEMAAAVTVVRLQATLEDARVAQRSGDTAHLVRVVEALESEAHQ